MSALEKIVSLLIAGVIAFIVSRLTLAAPFDVRNEEEDYKDADINE